MTPRIIERIIHCVRVIFLSIRMLESGVGEHSVGHVEGNGVLSRVDGTIFWAR
jgi:hypothetical protein